MIFDDHCCLHIACEFMNVVFALCVLHVDVSPLPNVRIRVIHLNFCRVVFTPLTALYPPDCATTFTSSASMVCLVLLLVRSVIVIFDIYLSPYVIAGASNPNWIAFSLVIPMRCSTRLVSASVTITVPSVLNFKVSHVSFVTVSVYTIPLSCPRADVVN